MTIDKRMHFVYQEGSAMFKFAVTNMADISGQLAARNGLTAASINWLVPHQANKRIIDATAQRVGITDDKVMMNIERYGNTTAGTIPLLLWDYEKQLKKADNLPLAAFGGGFTWGAVYLKWAYDGSKAGESLQFRVYSFQFQLLSLELTGNCERNRSTCIYYIHS